MTKLKNALVAALGCIAVGCSAFGIALSTQVNAFAEGEAGNITSARVALSNDIVVNYAVENVNADTAKMRFEYNGAKYEEQAEISEGKAIFAFDKVTPQYMGANVKAELLVNDVVVDTQETFSVKSYCEQLLAASASDLSQSEPENEAMRTLLVDMLYYGAEAQNYKQTDVENLVNKDLSSSDVELKTQFETLTEGGATLSGEQSDKFSWYGAGVRFDYNVSLYFVIDVKEEIENLSMTVGDTKITEFTTAQVEGATRYTARFTDVSATDFDKLFTVKVYEGETQIGQTATYGVKSYVYAMQNDANVAELVKATYNYGKSAKAYVKSISSLLVSGATTEYTEGDYFVTDNMTVQTKAVDGTLTEVSGYDYSVKTALTTDATEIVISYGGVSTSIPVSVTVGETFEYTVEAEVMKLISGNSSQNIGFFADSSATGYSGRGYLSNPSESTFEMRVKAPRTVAVDLSVVCARSNGTFTTDLISALTVNGNASEEFVMDKQNITSVTGSSGWYDWKEYRIARLKLQKGINVISVTFGYNSNVDYFTIESAREMEHNYTEWTVTDMPTTTEEGRLYRYCAHCGMTETAVVPNLTEGVYESVYTPASGKQVGYTTYTVKGEIFRESVSTVEELTFVVTDQFSESATETKMYATQSEYVGFGKNPVKSESSNKDEGVLMMSTGGKCGEITFKFNLSEDATVEFILNICRYKATPTELQYLDWFTYVLDGEDIAISDLLTIESAENWTTLVPTSLFTKNLTAGEHTLVIRVKNKRTGCLSGVTLKSETETAWTNKQ